MQKQIVLGFVRHLLTAAGGALSTSGYASANESELIVGGAVALIGVVWSILEKRAAAKKAAGL